MFRDATPRLPGGGGDSPSGSGDGSPETSLGRISLLSTWAPQSTTATTRPRYFLTPVRRSPAYSPLLDRSRSATAVGVDGCSGAALFGPSASATSHFSQPTSRSSSVPPLPIVGQRDRVLLSPLGGSDLVPSPVQPPRRSSLPSPVAMQASPSYVSLPGFLPITGPAARRHALQSRHPLRVALGAFCFLNAAVAFLFVWMMRTQQTAFALVAKRRRWDLVAVSNATCKAGIYYCVLGLVLLVDQLNSLFVATVLLAARSVRGAVPLLRLGLRWCVRHSRMSTLWEALTRRFPAHPAGESTEEFAPLMRGRLIRPPMPSKAAVTASAGLPAVHAGHLWPQRVGGSRGGPLLGGSLPQSPTNPQHETLVEVDMETRPHGCTIAGAPLSIRRRGA
ncbi:hypothetical protein NESM_000843200 [Novymonas esmeraldas]|uniref:Integral membrane protein n=1 Tax=Novymonas esmeraldas TaxID=1808958 RepID=A0AAW0EXM9_9TRYP